MSFPAELFGEGNAGRYVLVTFGGKPAYVPESTCMASLETGNIRPAEGTDWTAVGWKASTDASRGGRLFFTKLSDKSVKAWHLPALQNPTSDGGGASTKKKTSKKGKKVTSSTSKGVLRKAKPGIHDARDNNAEFTFPGMPAGLHHDHNEDDDEGDEENDGSDGDENGVDLSSQRRHSVGGIGALAFVDPEAAENVSSAVDFSISSPVRVDTRAAAAPSQGDSEAAGADVMIGSSQPQAMTLDGTLPYNDNRNAANPTSVNDVIPEEIIVDEEYKRCELEMDEESERDVIAYEMGADWENLAFRLGEAVALGNPVATNSSAVSFAAGAAAAAADLVAPVVSSASSTFTAPTGTENNISAVVDQLSGIILEGIATFQASEASVTNELHNMILSGISTEQTEESAQPTKPTVSETTEEVVSGRMVSNNRLPVDNANVATASTLVTGGTPIIPTWSRFSPAHSGATVERALRLQTEDSAAPTSPAAVGRRVRPTFVDQPSENATAVPPPGSKVINLAEQSSGGSLPSGSIEERLASLMRQYAAAPSESHHAALQWLQQQQQQDDVVFDKEGTFGQSSPPPHSFLPRSLANMNSDDSASQGNLAGLQPVTSQPSAEMSELDRLAYSDEGGSSSSAQPSPLFAALRRGDLQSVSTVGNGVQGRPRRLRDSIVIAKHPDAHQQYVREHQDDDFPLLQRQLSVGNDFELDSGDEVIDNDHRALPTREEMEAAASPTPPTPSSPHVVLDDNNVPVRLGGRTRHLHDSIVLAKHPEAHHEYVHAHASEGFHVSELIPPMNRQDLSLTTLLQLRDRSLRDSIIIAKDPSLHQEYLEAHGEHSFPGHASFLMEVDGGLQEVSSAPGSQQTSPVLAADKAPQGVGISPGIRRRQQREPAVHIQSPPESPEPMMAPPQTTQTIPVPHLATAPSVTGAAAIVPVVDIPKVVEHGLGGAYSAFLASADPLPTFNILPTATASVIDSQRTVETMETLQQRQFASLDAERTRLLQRDKNIAEWELKADRASLTATADNALANLKRLRGNADHPPPLSNAPPQAQESQLNHASSLDVRIEAQVHPSAAHSPAVTNRSASEAILQARLDAVMQRLLLQDSMYLYQQALDAKLLESAAWSLDAMRIYQSFLETAPPRVKEASVQASEVPVSTAEKGTWFSAASVPAFTPSAAMSTVAVATTSTSTGSADQSPAGADDQLADRLYAHRLAEIRDLQRNTLAAHSSPCSPAAPAAYGPSPVNRLVSSHNGREWPQVRFRQTLTPPLPVELALPQPTAVHALRVQREVLSEASSTQQHLKVPLASPGTHNPLPPQTMLRTPPVASDELRPRAPNTTFSSHHDHHAAGGHTQSVAASPYVRPTTQNGGGVVLKWDTKRSQNTLVSNSGVMAMADRSRLATSNITSHASPANTEISQQQQQQRVGAATAPMFALGTIGIAQGDFVFEVRLELRPSREALPSSALRGVHASIALRAPISLCYVGVASKYYRGGVDAALGSHAPSASSYRSPAYLYGSDGTITANGSGTCVPYGRKWHSQSTVTVHLSFSRRELSFALDGIPQGVAFKFLPQDDPEPLFPLVVFCGDGDGASFQPPTLPLTASPLSAQYRGGRDFSSPASQPRSVHHTRRGEGDGQRWATQDGSGGRALASPAAALPVATGLGNTNTAWMPQNPSSTVRPAAMLDNVSRSLY